MVWGVRKGGVGGGGAAFTDVRGTHTHPHTADFQHHIQVFPGRAATMKNINDGSSVLTFEREKKTVAQ